MAQIPLKNLNMGGIADSDYLGAANSVAEMVGLDIHSEPGVIKVNQKLTKESGTTVDDLIKAGVPCSDGKTYLFGSTNGKIWSRTSAGVWALEGTASPSAGSAGIVGAKEYQGYIYYAMQSRLGRWQIGTAWSGRNDSWANFANTDATYHPMRIVNLVLYIGDGANIAQVDGEVFSSAALVAGLGAPYRISSLGQMGTDLLIGTYVNSNIVGTQVFRWNTWSVSFSSSDPIPEVGINAFIEMDNFVLVNCGTKGNLYMYNGSQLDLYKQIKGSWAGTTNKAIVNAEAVLNFNGLPLFGLSKSSGTGVSLGVYSLGRANRNYPYVFNLEYVISTGHLTNVEIGALVGLGDQFLVSWKDTTSGTVYGVDVLDLSAKFSGAYFTTRVMALPDGYTSTSFGRCYVLYRSLPENTDITVSRKVNNGSMTAFEAEDLVTDSEHTMKATESEIGEATKVQVKVALTASGNTAPEVESLIINLPAQDANNRD